MVSPTLELSREKVQRAKCASNLKHLGAAWAAYLSDYGGYMPAYGGIIQFKWGVGSGWMNRLFPYLSPDAVGKGPSYPESANTKSTEAFRCPSLRRSAIDGRVFLSSYILNSRLYLDSTAGKFHPGRLKFPQKVIVLYDRNEKTAACDDADMTDEWGNSNGGDPWGRGGLWGSHTGSPPYPGPHSGGYNILFADWHVAWFGEWDSEKMTRHAVF